MKRIYIAGAHSADDVITVFENMRKGIRLSTKVFLAGYAPFCPWLDYHYTLMLRGDEKLNIQNYYQYSMAWLEVSQAMLVVPGWQKSKGTKDEIERALELEIPVYYSFEDFIDAENNKV